MAVHWIKMRTDLLTHPKIVRILSATKSDKFRTIGGLFAVWSVFDTHSTDGKLSGYTPELLDHVIGWEGFSAAMISAGWLIHDGPESLALPEFEEHNGQSAKRRSEDAKRKNVDRKSERIRTNVQNYSDKKRTECGAEKEEEKNKEHIGDAGAPLPASAGQKANRSGGKVTFIEFEDALPPDEDFIPADDPVFDYAGSVKLPRDFVVLEWEWFRAKYDGSKDKYIDWRKHFRNAVREGWGKLWGINGTSGEYYLTTAGKQLQAEIAARDAG